MKVYQVMVDKSHNTALILVIGNIQKCEEKNIRVKLLYW